MKLISWNVNGLEGMLKKDAQIHADIMGSDHCPNALELLPNIQF